MRERRVETKEITRIAADIAVIRDLRKTQTHKQTQSASCLRMKQHKLTFSAEDNTEPSQTAGGTESELAIARVLMLPGRSAADSAAETKEGRARAIWSCSSEGNLQENTMKRANDYGTRKLTA